MFIECFSIIFSLRIPQVEVSKKRNRPDSSSTGAGSGGGGGGSSSSSSSSSGGSDKVRVLVDAQATDPFIFIDGVFTPE